MASLVIDNKTTIDIINDQIAKNPYVMLNGHGMAELCRHEKYDIVNYLFEEMRVTRAAIDVYEEIDRSLRQI